MYFFLFLSSFFFGLQRLCNVHFTNEMKIKFSITLSILALVVVYQTSFVFCLVQCRRCLKVPGHRRVDSSLGTGDFRQWFSFSLRWGPLSLGLQRLCNAHFTNEMKRKFFITLSILALSCHLPSFFCLLSYLMSTLFEDSWSSPCWFFLRDWRFLTKIFFLVETRSLESWM